MLKIIKISLYFFIVTLPVYSETEIWRVNRDHSELFFKVPYLSLSHVTGRFTDYTGRISFNDKQTIPSLIKLKIKSSSIFTGSKIRDGHLKSKDFFHVKKYSHLLFISDNITPKGSGLFEVLGQLSIKNISKKVLVTMKIAKAVKDSWGFENRFISFKTQIDRNKFGLSWNKSLKNSELLVGHIIDIEGNFQIQPLAAKTPTFKYIIPVTKYSVLKEKLQRGDISIEDFKNQVKLETDAKDLSPIKTKQNTLTKDEIASKVPKDHQTFQKNPSLKSPTWWLAYSLMGFIGLLAMILISLQGKYTFLKLWPDHYQENTILGISGDFIAYSVAFLYVWAMWVIAFS